MIVQPGTVRFLPSRRVIPSSSLLLETNPDFDVFLHPVLLLSLDVASNTVAFLLISSLRSEDLKQARTKAHDFVWPRHFLIDEAWCEKDSLEQARDADLALFPLAKLTTSSLRLNTKLWIHVDKIYRIEARYLHSYPPKTGFNTPTSGKGLPNPPVCVDAASLSSLLHTAEKFTMHPICNEPSTPFVAQNLKVGQVFRLPLSSSRSNLLQAQNYSFFERPLGQPFLITHIAHTPHAWIRGFMLTKFHHRPIITHFPRDDDKTVWIRSQYLPLEGAEAVFHDRLPVVQLGEGSAQLGGRWYVNAMKSYSLGAGEVLGWVEEGEQGVYVEDGVVKALLDYQRGLVQRRWERRDVPQKPQQGLAQVHGVQELEHSEALSEPEEQGEVDQLVTEGIDDTSTPVSTEGTQGWSIIGTCEVQEENVEREPDQAAEEIDHDENWGFWDDVHPDCISSKSKVKKQGWKPSN
jgi:hypothetical protein